MKHISICLSVLLFASMLPHTNARILFTSEDLPLEGSTLILNATNSFLDGSTILFDTVLDSSISWNSADQRFFINKDVGVGGNLEVEGTQITLDADNVSTAQTVELIANQGTQDDGVLRYNPTTQQWEIKNGASAFAKVLTEENINSGALAALQLRRTTTFSFSNNTWTSVPFTTQDLQNAPSVLTVDNAFPERALILEDGLYLTTYRVNHNDSGSTHALESRLGKNGTEVVAGSEMTGSNYQNEYVPNTATTVAYLNAGDYITLDVQRSNNNQVFGDTLLTIIKLEQSSGISGNEASANPVIQLKDNTGNIDVNTANVTLIPWDTEDIKDSGITHSTTTNPSRVHLDTAGRYKVHYQISLTNTTNADKDIECYLLRNGNKIDGTSSFRLMRGNSYRQTVTGNQFLITSMADEYIEVGCEKYTGGSGAVRTVAESSWLHIEKK